jgi:hypothetical protein
VIPSKAATRHPTRRECSRVCVQSATELHCFEGTFTHGHVFPAGVPDSGVIHDSRGPGLMLVAGRGRSCGIFSVDPDRHQVLTDLETPGFITQGPLGLVGDVDEVLECAFGQTLLVIGVDAFL